MKYGLFTSQFVLGSYFKLISKDPLESFFINNFNVLIHVVRHCTAEVGTAYNTGPSIPKRFKRHIA